MISLTPSNLLRRRKHQAEHAAASGPSVALSVRNLTLRYGELAAVDDVSADFMGGSITGIIGPNGAGKSSMVSLLAGALPPTSGQVIFRGADVTGKPVDARCRLGMCMTHQIPHPFAEMTVLENVLIGTRFGRSERLRALGPAEALQLVGLFRDARARLASDLSPAELRRLELARCLATGAEILLIDEVGAGIHEAEIPQLVDVLKQVRNWGITIIMVEHVMDLLLRLADRLIVLDRGRILAQGDPIDVARRKDVVSVYFGAEVAP